MKFSLFGLFMVLLYVVGLTFVGYVAWQGSDYYSLALIDRPHHDAHTLLKPGGLYGHGLGIVGSCMILLLFLYSLRKRNKLGLRFGRIGRWLDIHIWFGIMGPLLITLHTAMKFKGIVSISYFSMMAVMLSGFIGRYIYKQIPRDETGLVLTLEQIENKINSTEKELSEQYNLSRSIINRIKALSGDAESYKGISALPMTVISDLMRPFRAWKLRKTLKKMNPDITSSSLAKIDKMAKSQSKLIRKRAALGTMNAFFHYWHVFHKPFAVVMIVVMFLHVTVVVLMGYKWVF